LIVYLTGHGNVDFPPADGAPASTTQLARVTVPVTGTIDGRNAEVLFAGLTPGFVGLAQVNLVVPAGTPSGAQPLRLRFGTATSAPVVIYVGN
jgi:adhesin/invasin